MLRGILWSSAICDCGDPELELKMEKLAEAGVNFFSSLIAIARKKFCRFLFKCVSGNNGDSAALYDLMEYDSEWWEHLATLIWKCNQWGLGIQYDILSAVTFSHREYMCYSNNIQRIIPSLKLATAQPTGSWAIVLDRLCKMLTPYINDTRLAAILGSLEGNAVPMEGWLRERFLAHGLRRDVIWITNCRTPGMVHSPHLHSVSEFKKAGAVYASTDGWSPNATQVKQIVAARKAKGDPAIELYHWAFSDGSNASAYQDRTRPSAAFIASKVGGQIKQLCS